MPQHRQGPEHRRLDRRAGVPRLAHALACVYACILRATDPGGWPRAGAAGQQYGTSMDDMGTVVAAQQKFKGNFPGPAPVLMLSREASADVVDAAAAAGSPNLRAPCAPGLLVHSPAAGAGARRRRHVPRAFLCAAADRVLLAPVGAAGVLLPAALDADSLCSGISSCFDKVSPYCGRPWCCSSVQDDACLRCA